MFFLKFIINFSLFKIYWVEISYFIIIGFGFDFICESRMEKYLEFMFVFFRLEEGEIYFSGRRSLYFCSFLLRFGKGGEGKSWGILISSFYVS